MKSERGAASANEFGVLQGCLVDGDAAQHAREVKIRRRSVLLSVLLQGMLLAAIIIVPLVSRPEAIAFASVTPIPPYHHSGLEKLRPHDGRTTTSRSSGPHFFINPSAPVAPISNRQDDGSQQLGDPNFAGDSVPLGMGCTSGCIDIANTSNVVPQPPTDTHVQVKRLHVGSMQPAALISRIEPAYPILAKQMHREGRVELHAIIAIDGSIQSLQAVSGDPLFFSSALEAVRQWRYRPTILNGQPVEIETTISVIYNLQH